ncbi:SpoIIE family protein phosphatase [Streptomyces rishiriensis]|uniref:Serine phosphatase RsbU (Regulator of sigma subunit)/anti-sigma regulatory factor (Ser/Thr protein kinase) n=1 Tax=Streptomyces rishiriensis TaxID=68264 RepID=A0ABU0NPA8_STRRH|nr:SpoIIE family protein phosphatase [Streptomyces rishiriensis]MDQ0580957.1 serine phosphatase RsbU (regulator of sigma subunit)/anti-sigma regulatory factor (Ser/Thr protein kinase) [Streptomyces rishiriensis]
MGAIPTQRETASRAQGAPAHPSTHSVVLPHIRATLNGSPLAPGAARELARTALTEWAALGLLGAEEAGGPGERLTGDTTLVVSELVTNAVVHAGTDVEVSCRLEEDPERAESPEHPGHPEPPGGCRAVVVEVSDHHPSRAPRDGTAEPSYGTAEYGRGLRLVAALADAWGVTYRRGTKTVWARLLPTAHESSDAGFPGHDDQPHPGHGHDLPGRSGHLGCFGHAGSAAHPDHPLGSAPALLEALAPVPQPAGSRDRDWLNRGALSFLAEASDLLAGQLDEDLVAALTGQLLVPRLADWCAVWLEDEVSGRGEWAGGPGPRLARVWHGCENRVEELRRALEKDPPCPPDGGPRSGPEPFAWPGAALGPHGTALAYRLIAGGRPLGTLVIGQAGRPAFADEVTGLVEDLGRRVALAIGAARQYARQATISAVLQRGLLPGAVAEIPGVRSALVYEPREQGGPSGDFYDLFPAGDGRWCFAVGDVQGKGPEAAVVIGLARPWLRLLAREGYGVADVLDRLNQLLLDDATEAADAAARAFVGPAGPGDGPQTRFLSLLYGELAPFEGGVRCTLASAGHPLPLLLGPDGSVATGGRPQTLLGVIEDVTYTSDSLELRPGDSLLCVTDGVTERRSGLRQFDDEDGLAVALAGCVGLDAELIAERIRRLVHEFGEQPPEDDLALLVLQAE